MIVASLGWGSQSVVMVAMSALGELPPIDFALHSDTTHERTETYAYAKRMTPWFEERGVKVVTASDTRSAENIIYSGSVSAYTLKQLDIIDPYDYVTIPARTDTTQVINSNARVPEDGSLHPCVDTSARNSNVLD
jgi:hypothetical protein